MDVYLSDETLTGTMDVYLSNEISYLCAATNEKPLHCFHGIQIS